MDSRTTDHLRGKREAAFLRQKLVSAVREFFISRDFLEVSTPTVVPCYSGEPYLEPAAIRFDDDHGSHYNGFLITSPEVQHKKLLAAGYPHIFELARCFRSGESLRSPHHNPEFTMLEWYRDNEDLETIEEDLLGLLQHLGSCGDDKAEIDWSHRERLSITEAFRRFAEIDFTQLDSWDDLFPLAREKNCGDHRCLDDAYYALFLNLVEPRLPAGYPVILHTYPGFQAANAETFREGRLEYARRFELYAGGAELANAYQELCDEAEQSRRLVAWQELRRSRGDIPHPVDPAYPAAAGALEHAAGIALGFDRLLMLLAGAGRLDEVLLYPGAVLFTKHQSP